MKSSVEIRRTLYVPPTIHTALPPTSYTFFDCAIFTDIGGRKHQEDRFTLCPKLFADRDDCAFFGVFDGTVGDYASENVKDLVVPQLVASPAWQKLKELLRTQSSENSTTATASGGQSQQEGCTTTGTNTATAAPMLNTAATNTTAPAAAAAAVEEKLPQLLEQAIDCMYKNADEELVQMCRENNKDYASSTSVTAVLVNGFIAVGHLGDSRIAMGIQASNGMNYEFLTIDHKPDMPHEKMRIIRHGGSVEYLHNHNNKPFIRGGDFSYRKSRGEQPMQLQYSRAFGGKDLKVYGLSNQPDIRVVKLTPQHCVMILATDGLWDVLSAQQAVDIAMQARKEGRNPAQALVETTLAEQQSRNQSADNITAMTVFFKRSPES